MIGRLAESKDAVLFAHFNEVDKCEFIKVNAPEDAWASTDDGAGVLVKADALREQAREVLVSAARCRTSSLAQPDMVPWLSLASAISTPACWLSLLSPKVAAIAFGTTAALAPAAVGPWLPLSNRCDWSFFNALPPCPSRLPSSGARRAARGEE